MRKTLNLTLSCLLLINSSNTLANLTDEEIETSLKRIAGACTAENGYDPANPGDVGEHELAPGEKAWRECVYTEIRADLIPRSGVPEQYEEIIAQDIRFSAAIEAGKMTRAERWQRNRASRAIIEANEQMADVEAATDENKQLDDFMNRQMEALLRTQPSLPRIMR